MRTAALHVGDRVEVNVRGLTFPAKVERILSTGEVDVMPSVPQRITYRRVSCRRIVKRLP